MCLKYGGFNCSVDVVAIWLFMVLFFQPFCMSEKNQTIKFERKKLTRIWPGLCVISQGLLIYEETDYIPTVFKYQVLIVEPLMSACPKTSGRNFTIPCLISIPQRAYHSMGMQSSCHRKIQTENISYSALNDITDSEEMAELPGQIIIAFNLPNTQQWASVNLVTCCLWKIKWQWWHLWQWNPYNILFFPTQVFQIKNKVAMW